MRHLVDFVTDLGDSALLVPASAILLAYLLYVRLTRTAVIWASTLALCACLTVLVKLAVYACGADFSLADLHSPSGHTSISVTFYGCCGLMMSTDKDRWSRMALVAGSAAIAVAVATSRVVLEVHTIADVIAGFLIGTLCVAWFESRYLRQPGLSLPWQPMLAALCLVALAMHGRHWNVEGVIAHIARLLQASLPFCR